MRHPSSEFSFTRVIAILLICFFIVAKGVSQVASPPTLEKTLQQKYLEKAFTLRGFYGDYSLHFDNTGAPLGNLHPDSWTTAIVVIKKLQVSESKIQLEGVRLAEMYNVEQSKFVPVLTKQKIVIVVDRNASETESEVTSSLGRIFLNQNDHLIDLVPSYWRPFLSSAIEKVPQQTGTDCYRTKGSASRDGDGTISWSCEENAKLKTPTPSTTDLNPSSLPYRAGKGVSAPHPIFTPDPDYSDLARTMKFGGVTILQTEIKTDGTTSNTIILRPLGFGLDERAVAAIKIWKFSPAVFKNQPVPVLITVQVEFHKY